MNVRFYLSHDIKITCSSINRDNIRIIHESEGGIEIRAEDYRSASRGSSSDAKW